MNLQSFLILLVIFILLAVAIVYIGQNNGWDNAGCHGNCAKCHKHCSNPNQPPKS